MADSNNTLPLQGGTTQAYALLTLTAVCWAMNAVLGKYAVGEISPMALVSLRWLGAVLLMAAFAHQKIRRDWPILRTRLIYLLFMGALGFTGFNMLFYMSAHSTSAVNIGILQGSIPVFVLIGAMIFLGTRVGILQSAGVLLTIIGVVIIGAGGNLLALESLVVNPGDLMMLAACLLYAGYTVGLRYRPDVSALSFFTIMACAAFLTSIPFTFIEISLDHFQAPTTKGWMVVVIVTLFPSFIAQLSFMRGVEILGPSRAGVFVNLVPIFASIMAVAFLGEPFELYHGLALGLVLFGIWMSERGK